MSFVQDWRFWHILQEMVKVRVITQEINRRMAFSVGNLTSVFYFFIVGFLLDFVYNIFCFLVYFVSWLYVCVLVLPLFKQLMIFICVSLPCYPCAYLSHIPFHSEPNRLLILVCKQSGIFVAYVTFCTTFVIWGLFQKAGLV